ncbi:MAG: DNA-binding response regulator [Planctomycetota bacterium]|nr:MAG: DNA-binding response regulator [Planctomycetota bacterium]
MNRQNPTVFVIDDDAAVRDSLKYLIESVGHRVRTFASANEFLDACTTEHAGCILADVRMPGMSGLELQERLVARAILMPTIIITGHGDVAMAVRAMKAGALDFIEKPFSDQVLLDQIHVALERDTREREKRDRQRRIQDRFSLLSPRERTVMDKVVAGKSNKTIAAELGLSQKTVEVHRAHVMAKVKADSLAQLVHMALQNGLTAQ